MYKNTAILSVIHHHQSSLEDIHHRQSPLEEVFVFCYINQDILRMLEEPHGKVSMKKM
jgi:hypothetical protein